jgi:hypothetical protein
LIGGSPAAPSTIASAWGPDTGIPGGTGLWRDNSARCCKRRPWGSRLEFRALALSAKADKIICHQGATHQRTS